ncbi:protein kinase [Mycobacterium asiaticum]|uniref:non-specific serine/threonine protein kinase n=1 Tax=Mycobacterium asiaticum TaxID=1790 RepID=A0A1A3NDY6_MYCAS|nr:protein kinase [Mycobacterium asiaticum]
MSESTLLGGRYELGPVLGRGGMAEVREGWDGKLRRKVAIKLLSPLDETRPENRLRFETEARAAAALSSQHIVVVHDVGEHHGVPYIVMERLPGESLADHIARGPLPQAFVQSVLEDVLEALAVAHHAGIVHRDVKPGNVLFTATGEAKLADFGIAKTSGGVQTMTGEIVGSMAYLSADRLTGKPATPADDLYALGVVGYEALTGRRPFPQTQLGPLAQAIMHESPVPIAALRPDVWPHLAAVIEQAMARGPAQRFHHAVQMRAALGSPGPASPPAPNPTRAMTAPLPAKGTRAFVAPPLDATFVGPPLDAPTSRRGLWAAALIATFLVAVLLIVFIQPFSTPPPSPAGTTAPLAPTPPPPTTTVAPATTVASIPEPAPPPRGGPPGKHGKKPKGGKGD